MWQRPDGLDLFDRVQLEAVVSVCRRSTSMADAGRKLFAATRTRRTTQNDSDRLRKYLARFELDWAATQRTGAN
jgi:transcriptional regulatory protein RtcR